MGCYFPSRTFPIFLSFSLNSSVLYFERSMFAFLHSIRARIYLRASLASLTFKNLIGSGAASPNVSM